ncbi:MAG: hypothetical protein PWQ09_966 [Candidatus Cloacimonadota bacterium]|nr:hypothetical protein [Candidatus Cloacimonadota bacterium]
MKKVLVVTLIFLSLFLYTATIKYDQNWAEEGLNLDLETNSNVEMTFSLHQFNLEQVEIDGEAFQSITMNGSFLPNKAGAPNLPALSRYIALPNGAEAQLQVLDYKMEVMENIEVAPAYKIPIDTDGKKLEYKKDEEIYSENKFYPENPFQISGRTKIRGINAALLSVEPFQYNPVTKELRIYTNVKLNVKFTGGNGTFGEARLRSRWWDPILKDIFANHRSLPNVNYNKRSKAKDQDFEYLIVVPDNPDFIAWADTLKNFRQKQGIRTGVVTLAEIGANDENVIEDYIDNAYNNWNIPPAAVLLMADYGTGSVTEPGITSFTLTHPYTGTYISDNLYADVNGDDLPDITFARMTADNADELQTLVQKAINYEINPPTDANFYDNPLTAMGWQTERWFQLCSEVTNGFWEFGLGKNPVRQNAIYEGSPGGIWSTATNTSSVVNYFGPNGLGYIPEDTAHLTNWNGSASGVNNAINSGAFMVQHRDHGFEYGWGEPDYDMNDVNSLTNENLTYVFSVNCLTGKFNNPGGSFAETFHHIDKGALGLLAATEVSYSFVNDVFIWGVYDYFWPEFMPDEESEIEYRGILPAFGNVAGKYFLQQSSWPYNSQDKEVTYNLFHAHGDAFTTVYSEIPQQLSVVHDDVLLSGLNFFTITADEDAYISLSIDGEILATATGIGMPQDITIEPQVPLTQIDVVVTKQNYYRYHSVVEVIPPDMPYVMYKGNILEDENENGQIDYDENVLVDAEIENIGSQTAENVELLLTSTDPFVTIFDDNEIVGSISQNENIVMENAFEFYVASDVPDQHELEFTLYISDDSKETWDYDFNITANAPILETGIAEVDDSAGNADNKIDPGETVDILIPTSNIGNSNSVEGQAILSCDNELISIQNSLQTTSVIITGEVLQTSFTFDVDESIEVGTPITFNYELTTGEYSSTASYTYKVGLTFDDFETGDFSEYPWEFFGNAEWQITSEEAYEGVYSAKSGSINNWNYSSLVLELEVLEAGEISFWKKISSEEDGDKLKFMIDNVQKGVWSGEEDWNQESYSVTAGNHRFEWKYYKNSSGSGGSDCAWIDYILFPALQTEQAPEIQLDQQSIAVEIGQNTTLTDTLKVENIGNSTLNFAILEEIPWLEIAEYNANVEPGDFSEVILQFSSYDMALDTYEDEFTVVSETQEILVPITMQIINVSNSETPELKNYLAKNHPNPFNPETKINFSLKKAGEVRLEVYNIKGQLVKTLQQGYTDAGEHFVVWRGRDENGQKVTSGIYFYRLQTENMSKTRKMLLLK